MQLPLEPAIEEEGGSVLIVPRAPSRGREYTTALATSGFDTLVATSRTAALKRLKSTDLVLVEVGRFDPEGWDFCRQLRARHPSLPIIGVTDRAEGDLVEHLLEAGVDDHLVRPYRAEALVARVRARIRRSRSARIRSIQTRQRREEYFRSLIEGSHEVIVLVDAKGSIRYGSPSLLQLVGKAESDVLGSKLFDFVHEQDRPAVRTLLAELVSSTTELATGSYRLRNASGTWRTFEVSVRNLLANEAVAGIVVNGRDVTERQAAEDALRANEERFRLIVEGSREVFFYVRSGSGELVYVSPSVDAVLGRSPEELTGREAPWTAESGEESVRQGSRTVSAVHADGRTMILELVENPLGNGGSGGSVQGFARDVSERERAQGALRDAAFQDDLTSLPNRALFTDRVGQAIARSRRNPDHRFALLFIDLDRFKIVNDSLGHTVGDHLLVAIAERLRDHLRPQDTLARFGGDEFAILLEDLPAPADAPRVAHRIAGILAPPFQLDGYEIYATASVGIVMGSATVTSSETLLQNADMAMYRAKARGGASFEVYDQEMHAQAVRRLQLENQLRRAVEREELCLNFQPIIELASGTIVGAEALLRWNHPIFGVIAPTDFVGLAEETGYITTIAEWALDAACAALAGWQRRTGRSDLFVSVNLSPRQFRDSGVVQHVRSVLERHRIDPHHLRLEVTEAILVDSRERVTRILHELWNLGVEIYLDDFGTGYSSLTYLHSLPLNGVKMDSAFVARLPHDHRFMAVAEHVLRLAGDLGLKVIAEGVEEPEQERTLQRLGCEYGQGFLLSAPIHSDQLPSLFGELDSRRTGSPSLTQRIPATEASA